VFQNDFEAKDYEWIENFRKLVHDKIISGELKTDEIQKLLFMNRTQYYAKVKALTGETPAALIKEIRLEIAYELISQPNDLRISDVVQQLGLSDTKNFSKIFKDKYGVTPREVKPKGKY